jgi:glycosyltransferase involved in cell wall biosynthesis
MFGRHARAGTFPQRHGRRPEARVMPVRVCVDTRLGSGLSGGVEQVVIGLAAALSRLEDGDEEYLFLAHPDQDEWIRPYMRGPCRLLHSRLPYPGQPGAIRALRRAARERASFLSDRQRFVARSDGTVERAGVHVVHFAIQEAFLTELPSIYQPHDLQHLHLPELFSGRELRRREVVYRTHCERAATVVAMTSWGKRDLVSHYGLPAEKVAVVPWGSVLGEYPDPSARDLDQVRARLGLPDQFLLYPAQTWPHKNHERLLEALALLKRRDDLNVPLVCPGKGNRFFAKIERRVHELELGRSVLFPGFVSPLELRALYRLSRGLVFPSRFEGWGLPVCEAFAEGVPVVSSSATGLSDLVGEAGLLFDPDDIAQMADRISQLWRDPELREQLRERGRRRAQRFSFDHSARLLRAHYRRLAGKRLPEQDRILVSSSPPA